MQTITINTDTNQLNTRQFLYSVQPLLSAEDIKQKHSLHLNQFFRITIETFYS